MRDGSIPDMSPAHFLRVAQEILDTSTINQPKRFVLSDDKVSAIILRKKKLSSQTVSSREQCRLYELLKEAAKILLVAPIGVFNF